MSAIGGAEQITDIGRNQPPLTNSRPERAMSAGRRLPYPLYKGCRGGPVLLIVLYEARSWRFRPGETFTFGRAPACSLPLPGNDHGVSRSAGSVAYRDGTWWLRNDSTSSLLHVLGDRGFRVELPPGMSLPLQQWHTQVRLKGVLAVYTIRLRLPALDDAPTADPAVPTGDPAETSTRRRLQLTDEDRLVLAARFETYLTRGHAGAPAPCSAREAAARIGWQPHTVAKRCENIRERYVRLGVPGLHGPRALEELAELLVSTGELSVADLRRLPDRPHRTRPGSARFGRR